MTKRILLLAFLFAPSLCRAIGLPEAQQKLLSQNADLLMAKRQVEISATTYREALANWQPSITANGSYIYQSKTPEIEIPINPAVGTQTRPFGDKDRVDLSLEASYGLFTGFSRYYRAAGQKSAMKAEQVSLQSTQNRFSFELGSAYFFWELAFKRVEAQEAMISQLAEYALQSKNQSASGVVTYSRYAEAQSQFLLSKAELAGYVERRDSLAREIAFQIQEPETDLAVVEPYRMPDSLQIHEALSVELDAGRPEIAALEFNANQLSSFRKGLFGRYLPSLYASAAYHYAKPGINAGATEFMGYGVAGLNASWTLYDGFTIASQRDRLWLQEQNVQAQKNRLLMVMQKQLQTSKGRLRQALDQMSAAREAYGAAQIVVRDLKNRLDAGTATSLEYLTAVRNEASARFFVDQSAFAIKMGYLSVLFAAGKEIRF